ncbi:hypothetical protein [Streptomyces antibioticus]|uniref:hypothetical protein n=1 Tax=Streptomyces antibioticus TaxID=1890 RepID=UPI003402FE6D
MGGGKSRACPLTMRAPSLSACPLTTRTPSLGVPRSLSPLRADATTALIPPFAGVAALEAVAEGEPLWLEDPARDATRHLLIGDPPTRWPSRARIPVPEERAAAAVVGCALAPARSPPPRGPCCAGPSACAPDRCAALWPARRAAPRATAGAGPDPTRCGTTSTPQRIFDALPGPTVLLLPLWTETGAVEDVRIEAAAPSPSTWQDAGAGNWWAAASWRRVRRWPAAPCWSSAWTRPGDTERKASFRGIQRRAEGTRRR